MGIASFWLQTISGCYCLFDVRALKAELRVGLLRGAVSTPPESKFLSTNSLFGAPIGQDHGTSIMTSFTKGFVAWGLCATSSTPNASNKKHLWQTASRGQARRILDLDSSSCPV